MQRQRVAYHLDFAREAGVVQTGSASRRLSRIEAREGGQQRRRRGGIADPHFARPENFRERPRVLPPQLDRVCRLLAGHRRFAREVAGGAAYAHIDDHRLDPEMSGTAH